MFWVFFISIYNIHKYFLCYVFLSSLSIVKFNEAWTFLIYLSFESNIQTLFVNSHFQKHLAHNLLLKNVKTKEKNYEIDQFIVSHFIYCCSNMFKIIVPTLLSMYCYLIMGLPDVLTVLNMISLFIDVYMLFLFFRQF